MSHFARKIHLNKCWGIAVLYQEVSDNDIIEYTVYIFLILTDNFSFIHTQEGVNKKQKTKNSMTKKNWIVLVSLIWIAWNIVTKTRAAISAHNNRSI